MPQRPHYTTPVRQIQRQDCEALLRLALLEDAPAGDVTSESIFDADETGRARVMAREPGVLCGVSVIDLLFEIDAEATGRRITLTTTLKDGDAFEKGSSLMEISGNLPALLRLERPMLNLLQYLSGISTNVARAVKQAGSEIKILDTRKTLPGYRKLAKFAVYCGGGTNHRISLSDMAMVKDNHIAASGGIASALGRLHERAPDVPVEVEIDEPEQLDAVLKARPLPRVILLDNMSRKQIEECVARLSTFSHAQRPFVEVSGGRTPDDLEDLRGLGPLGVSMGFLTHTTRFLDLGLDYVS